MITSLPPPPTPASCLSFPQFSQLSESHPLIALCNSHHFPDFPYIFFIYSVCVRLNAFPVYLFSTYPPATPWGASLLYPSWVHYSETFDPMRMGPVCLIIHEDTLYLTHLGSPPFRNVQDRGALGKVGDSILTHQICSLDPWLRRLPSLRSTSALLTPYHLLTWKNSAVYLVIEPPRGHMLLLPASFH
jgi:hypothetical protein